MNEPVRCAIITVSDRSASGQRPDLSGPAVIGEIRKLGWSLILNKIIPDEFITIRALLKKLADEDQVDLVLTTGGTGCSPRDVTPEATLSVIEKNVPGLAEVMRMESLKSTPHGMLSRGIAGICHNTLIINLPGNPNGAVENLTAIAAVIPHAVALIHSTTDAESGHHLDH